jgi:hypothetical protein
MDKPVAHGAMTFRPDSSSPIKEDTASACLTPSPLVSNPTVFTPVSVSYYSVYASPDQEAIFGSAGPYDDDGESASDAERAD